MAGYDRLDEWVECVYKEIGRERLNPYIVSKHFWIELVYHDRCSAMLRHPFLRAIALDMRKSKQEQWQEYAHELGHLLWHSGKQGRKNGMHTLFEEKQEYQADRFMYVFCIPDYQIHFLTESPSDQCTIQKLARDYGVTMPFARKRWAIYKATHPEIIYR